MDALKRLRTVAIVLVVLASSLVPAHAAGQPACVDTFYAAINDFLSTCNLGAPNAEGTTMEGQLDNVGARRAYLFRVGQERRAGYIYLGDQWYDMEVALYTEDLGTELGRWKFTVASRESGARVLQFVRPDKITPTLDANRPYLLLVYAVNPANFDPRRGYTLRVALAPPVCAVEPNNDPDALYALGMSYEPAAPGPFSLISFNAFVTPPYSDLFDFEWQIDGRTLPGETGLTVLRAGSDLKAGDHKVRVTARGAREYPDPAQPHMPPTLSVECTVQVTP